MIIECPSCHARFRMDENKIKGRGARVRCRRCKESIVVLKSEATPPEPPPLAKGEFLDLRSAVRETLRERIPAAAPPPPPPQLSPEPPIESAPESPLPDKAVEAFLAPPPPVPEDVAAPSPPDFSPFADTHAVPELPAPPAPPAAKDEVDIAFDHFLSPPTAGEVSPAAAAKEEAPAAGELAVDFAPEEKLELHHEAPAEEQASSEFLVSKAESIDFLKEEYEKKGSGEKLDLATRLPEEPPIPFLADEPAEPAPGAAPWEPQVAAPVPPVEFQAEAEKQHPLGVFEKDEAPLPVAAETAKAKEPLRLKIPEPRKTGSSLFRPSLLVLVLLFLTMAGGGGYLGFTRSGQDILRGIVPGMESLWLRGGGKAGPQYDIRNLIGYYEPQTKAGRLFIIKGQVANLGAIRRSGIRIRAALLDNNDQTVMDKTTYAGNIVSGEMLRQSSREKIDEALSNRFGDRLVNMDIAPGKSVPFMIVFINPPDGISAYRLEALDGE